MGKRGRPKKVVEPKAPVVEKQPEPVAEVATVPEAQHVQEIEKVPEVPKVSKGKSKPNHGAAKLPSRYAKFGGE